MAAGRRGGLNAVGGRSATEGRPAANAQATLNRLWVANVLKNVPDNVRRVLRERGRSREPSTLPPTTCARTATAAGDRRRCSVLAPALAFRTSRCSGVYVASRVLAAPFDFAPSFPWDRPLVDSCRR